MLSYEKCIELRDNGFPQPQPAPYQVWYGLTLAPSVKTCIVSQEGAFGERVKTDHGFTCDVQFFKDRDAVYCPTVETMLSLLKPGYYLTRDDSGNFVLISSSSDMPVEFNESLIDLLAEAWIENRFLFEDNGRQESGK